MKNHKWFYVPLALITVGIFSLVFAFRGGTGPRNRIQVFPVADCIKINGVDFSLTAKDLGVVLAAAYAQQTPIPLLFEHKQTPHGGTAAGWLRDCSVDSKGMWCFIEWTPYGRAAACTGGWRFISPGGNIEKGADGKAHPIDLDEASLTNVPALDGMARVEVPGCPIPFFSNIFAAYPGVKGLDTNP